MYVCVAAKLQFEEDLAPIKRREQTLPVLVRSMTLWVPTFRPQQQYVQVLFVQLELGLSELNSALCSPLYPLAQGLGSYFFNVHEMDKGACSQMAPNRGPQHYLLMPKLCQGRDELQKKYAYRNMTRHNHGNIDTLLILDVSLLSTTLANSSLPQNKCVVKR